MSVTITPEGCSNIQTTVIDRSEGIMSPTELFLGQPMALVQFDVLWWV